MIKSNIVFGSDILKYTFSDNSVGNGITLCSVTAGGFKTAGISVSFVMPLCEKASLFALVPNVLTRSSEKYPDISCIERELAVLYGAEISADVSKSGENQIIKFEVGSIDDRFALDGESIQRGCCELLFELIFKPKISGSGFDRAVVESEKRQLCERLDAETAEKQIYARRRCEEIMFADESYGINKFGTKQAINEANAETVYEAYREMLTEAPMFICVSGSGEGEFVKELIAEYTAGINRAPEKNTTLFVESAEDVTYFKETDDVKQGKLVMGFRLGMTSPNDNYAARRVMINLFGGSPNSKLFTVVREKMSLCYYCSAGMISQKGVMFVSSGIESYNEDVAKKAILDQLEAVKHGDFTDDDIDHAKKSLEDSFKSITDSPESLDVWFMSQVVNDSFKYPEQYVEEFNAVTREQIIEAASQVTLDTVFMLAGTGKGGEVDE